MRASDPDNLSTIPRDPERHPLDDGIWVVRSPLPDLHTALSRRAALFGAMLVGTGVASAGVAAVAIPLPKALDAELIDLATRTVALARHQQEVDYQATAAQGEIDRWNFANRPAVPVLPELIEIDALVAASRGFHEAREAHKRGVADRAAASNAPSLIALSNRLWQDLIHSVGRLAEMEAATLAGVAAKARVAEALAENDDNISEWWGQSLLRSVAEDALRLHNASVLA